MKAFVFEAPEGAVRRIVLEIKATQMSFAEALRLCQQLGVWVQVQM